MVCGVCHKCAGAALPCGNNMGLPHNLVEPLQGCAFQRVSKLLQSRCDGLTCRPLSDPRCRITARHYRKQPLSRKATMGNFEYFVLARVIHVLGVVLWIGGVAFVTTVLIPSLRDLPNAGSRLQLFEQLEGKFALQARIVTLLTGISGFYMLHVMDAWARYQQLQFWWLHLMTLVWGIFTLVLFVLEPLVLHRWFRQRAIKNSDNAFLWLHRMHKILLTLSLIAVAGAVAGSHGYSFATGAS